MALLPWQFCLSFATGSLSDNSWRSLRASNIFNIFQFLAHFTALARHQCRDMISSLNVQVLYCERAIEVLLPFAVSNIYFTQTFIQSNTQGAEVLTTWRLHLELNFTLCLLYLKASQVACLNRCWCMFRHNYGILLLDCDAHCLSLKFRCFHGLWQVQTQLRRNNQQSTIKIATHYTTIVLCNHWSSYRL